MSQFINLTETLSLAFHAMVHLAENIDGKPSSAKAIGQRFGATEPLVTKTLQRLLRAGLIRSYKGPGGGYILDPAPENVSLLDVVEAVEGPLRPQGCTMRNCSVAPLPPCPVGSMVESVSRGIGDAFKSYTVADMVSWFRDEGVIKAEMSITWAPKLSVIECSEGQAESAATAS